MFDDFARRVVRPTGLDVVLGVVAVLLEPEGTPRLGSLPLVATEVGRRTLVVDGRRLPLYQPGRPPVRVVLSVRRG